MMSWYLAYRAQTAAWFPSDHLSSPDKSSCWKSSSFLPSIDILIGWIPFISFNFSSVLGASPTRGTIFAATTWVTNTLVIVIGVTIRFFTTTATHLLLAITLVYVFTTLKLWGKWGPSPPFRDWVIICILFPRSRAFIWQCIIMDEKVSISSLFVVLTASFKSARSYCLVCGSLPLNWKSCSLTCQQLGYPQSI